jgi:hypothetical protein
MGAEISGFLDMWNCKSCEHYDADHHCSLTTPLVKGYIRQPSDVVCVRYQPDAAGRGHEVLFRSHFKERRELRRRD